MRENPKESARLCFHLPLELSTEILARLLAKTLLKFRCVCKEWNSLIHNPNFAYLHLTLYKNNRENSPLMIVESKENHRDHLFLSLRRNTAKTWSTSRVKVPRDPATHFFYANCYAKGLFVWKRREETPGRGSEHDVLFFVLWNPSIRKYLRIPAPFPRCCDSGPYAIGLGYDFVDNDAKLVLLNHIPAYTPSNYGKPISVAAYIYSIKTRSWRNSTIDHQVTRRHIYSDCSISLCGAVHIIATDFLDEFIRILAFNVRNEVFSYFPLPDAPADLHGFYSRLGVLGESLALLLRSTVWVMEEYGVVESWVRRYTYDFECPYGVLYFSRNGVIFAKKNGMQVYDLESGEIEDLEKDALPDYLGVYMNTFEDNLMLLGEADDKEFLYASPSRESGTPA